MTSAPPGASFADQARARARRDARARSSGSSAGSSSLSTCPRRTRSHGPRPATSAETRALAARIVERHLALPRWPRARASSVRDVEREGILVGPCRLDRARLPGGRERARDPPRRRAETRPDVEHAERSTALAELTRRDELAHRGRPLGDVAREREPEARGERRAGRRDGAPRGGDGRVVRIGERADERAELARIAGSSASRARARPARSTRASPLRARSERQPSGAHRSAQRGIVSAPRARGHDGRARSSRVEAPCRRRARRRAGAPHPAARPPGEGAVDPPRRQGRAGRDARRGRSVREVREETGARGAGRRRSGSSLDGEGFSYAVHEHLCVRRDDDARCAGDDADARWTVPLASSVLGDRRVRARSPSNRALRAAC